MTGRYRRHPSLRVTALDSEGVALHLDTHQYFSVNATGLKLLEALSAPRTLDELGAALVAEYDVETSEAIATAQVFLEQCLARQMIVATP